MSVDVDQLLSEAVADLRQALPDNAGADVLFDRNSAPRTRRLTWRAATTSAAAVLAIVVGGLVVIGGRPSGVPVRPSAPLHRRTAPHWRTPVDCPRGYSVPAPAALTRTQLFCNLGKTRTDLPGVRFLLVF